MGKRVTELMECRECGAAVSNERVHKRWHDTVVLASRKSTGTPFVGVPADQGPSTCSNDASRS